MRIRVRTEGTLATDKNSRLMDLEFPFQKVTHVWLEDPENKMIKYKIVKEKEKVEN